MLDLRQLRYFVAVAESEHVTHAAEQLNVSQSPLSRQIMQLEAQLGLVLFERARQRIRLTAEGREFLGEARALLERAERVEDLGRRLGEGTAGALAIGYVEAAVHAGLVGAALRRFRQERPGVQVRLRSQRSALQIEGLRERSLDLGMVYNPPPPGDDEIASAEILREPLVLALPASHPLVHLRRISPPDLDGQPWITVVRQPHDTNRDQFLAACAQAGFSPDIAYETADPLTSLGLVGAGLGLATVQASLRGNAPADVAFRDLPWFGRAVAVHLAWRRHDARPAISAFRRAAGEAGTNGAAGADAQSPR